MPLSRQRVSPTKQSNKLCEGRICPGQGLWEDVEPIRYLSDIPKRKKKKKY